MDVKIMNYDQAMEENIFIKEENQYSDNQMIVEEESPLYDIVYIKEEPSEVNPDNTDDNDAVDRNEEMVCTLASRYIIFK